MKRSLACRLRLLLMTILYLDMGQGMPTTCVFGLLNPVMNIIW